MSPKTAEVLALLRKYNEGESSRTPDGAVFATIYLDNARPEGMSAPAFAGHLSALKALGLYKGYGDDAFGEVKLA
jgi:hypothetical protein